MKKLLILLIIIILANSCVKEPTNTTNDIAPPPTEFGAYILCEGLWNRDNATLSRYDFRTGEIINDFFGKANPNLKLGDIANHLLIKGDTTLIAVTTTRTIEFLNTKTGTTYGRIFFTGKNAPRNICIINDTLGFVTDLYSHSIHSFNPKNISQSSYPIPVGPAPEGITHCNGKLFVANSGYGDYLAHLPKAGTISVINLQTFAEEKTIDYFPNIIEIIADTQKNIIYCAYNHLPSLKDSIGGIVALDVNTYEILFHIKTKASRLCFSSTKDTLFFISNNNISLLDLKNNNLIPKVLIENPKNEEMWYALAYCAFDNTLWIGNARNYQMNGEIIIYSLNNPTQPLKRFEVGVNPNSISFFKF